MKLYIVWQLSNDSHYIEGIYDNLETAKQQMEKIKNEWPEPSIYSMELNEPRKEPDWGDFAA